MVIPRNTTNMGKVISYHNVDIKCKVSDLFGLLEKIPNSYCDEHNTGEDKVNFDFCFEGPGGREFFVYDWKEYRRLAIHSIVDFHIGAESRSHSLEAKEFLIKKLYG